MEMAELITSLFIHIFAIIFLFVRKSLNKRYIWYYGTQTVELFISRDRRGQEQLVNEETNQDQVTEQIE